MDLSALSRTPDTEGPGLTASDAADRLILDEAAPLLADLSSPVADRTVVVDDSYGALTLGAADLLARRAEDPADPIGTIRVHQDSVTSERALTTNTHRLGSAVPWRHAALTPESLSGASVVLMRLPRSLDRLAEVAALVAAHAADDVVVVAGGRIKHMSLSMNDVLADVFGRVDVSHARQKSRVLFASAPRRREAIELVGAWPRREHHADLDMTVCAHGGVFAGTRIDIGTRLLLDHLDDAPTTQSAVDLACGNGTIAAVLARRRPDMTILATDRSAVAVESTRATLAANDIADSQTTAPRVRVQRADGLENVADSSARLILLNPPFHSDAAISTGIATHLFADAARALTPGGELWCVWNSHLRYRPALQRIVGPTRQVARNAKFTLTASRRP